MIPSNFFKEIDLSIDEFYDHMLMVLTGPNNDKFKTNGKSILFSALSHNEQLSLPGLFYASAAQNGRAPLTDNDMVSSLDIASNYVDSLRSTTKARVRQELNVNVEKYKDLGSNDFREKIENVMEDVFGKLESDFNRIVAAESTKMKNVGASSSIERVARDQHDDNPNVAFLVVHDNKLCNECKRLHTIGGVIPRVWRLSEMKQSYHKKGEDSPSVSGLHPHCRCQICFIPKGYTFDSSGTMVWKSPGFDVYLEQNKV